MSPRQRVDGTRRALAGALLSALIGMVVAAPAAATPRVPRADDEVLAVLPRAARQAAPAQAPALAAPTDPVEAVRMARSLLDAARADGDPRLAGQALARLAAWADPASAPIDVLLMQATVRQYLHDFDGAIAALAVLLRRAPGQAQGWLTLATLHRVQGRLGASDEACARLVALRVTPHGEACLAENAALRGDVASARAQFERWLSAPAFDGPTRAWLATTLGELEARAGRAGAAERAFRWALDAADDGYARLAYADLLLDEQRPRAALALLADAGDADAVLLRRALAVAQLVDRGADVGASDAKAPAEVIARYTQAALRPGQAQPHAREASMVALHLQRDAAAAVRLARDNLRQQREPIDVLLLAEAAQASGDAEAWRSLDAVLKETGLQDARIEALRAAR